MAGKGRHKTHRMNRAVNKMGDRASIMTTHRSVASPRKGKKARGRMRG